MRTAIGRKIDASLAHETDVLPDEDHPLVTELRQMLAKPGATTVGAFAQLTERLMAEFTLVKPQVVPPGDGHGSSTIEDLPTFVRPKQEFTADEIGALAEFLKTSADLGRAFGK